ncbi:hypothetical protein [uncultured Amphritea sp.]|uniref:hypothetical protein n=1 Tax=uncultured Amphritea sp. TaxID=981605 RepID=UPI0025CB9801|nr:hypothetical protein [uncultured Amphritea sp.]
MDDSIINQAWFPIALMLSEFALGGVVAFQIAVFKQIAKNKVDLLNYKLEVSQTYAKDSEIKEMFKRLDDKLDRVLSDVHHNNN